MYKISKELDDIVDTISHCSESSEACYAHFTLTPYVITDDGDRYECYVHDAECKEWIENTVEKLLKATPQPYEHYGYSFGIDISIDVKICMDDDDPDCFDCENIDHQGEYLDNIEVDAPIEGWHFVVGGRPEFWMPNSDFRMNQS